MVIRPIGPIRPISSSNCEQPVNNLLTTFCGGWTAFVPHTMPNFVREHNQQTKIILAHQPSPLKTMPILKFKRFNKPQILKHIGRNLLTQFFARFNYEFETRSFALPPPELPDAEYFAALAGLLMHPEGLPDSLNEALYAID